MICTLVLDEHKLQRFEAAQSGIRVHNHSRGILPLKLIAYTQLYLVMMVLKRSNNYFDQFMRNYQLCDKY